MALIGAHKDILGHGAIRRRFGAGAAKHDGLAAEVAAAGLAVIAKAAGARWICRHPLANLHRVHAVSHGSNFSRELVTQNKWTFNCLRAAMAIVIVVQVRAADSNAAATQQDHSRLQFGAAVLLHTDVPGAIEQGCFH